MFLSIKRNKLFAMSIAGAMLAIGPIDPMRCDAGDHSLTVHFEVNQSQITDEAKRQIQNFLKTHNFTGGANILVLGYTDASGPEVFNHHLSTKRAEAVKNLITKYQKFDIKQIRTQGFGPNAPVSSNKDAHGRARNRRAEIYLRGVKDGRLQHLSSVRSHNKYHIDKYIQEAKKLMFQEQWDLALLKLEAAEQLGGKKHSDWHLTYGAVGFYAGRQLEQLRPIFQRALKLNPYNSKARDFLGRIKAREEFIAKKHEPYMGLTVHHPIKVGSHYQLYEYLRLLKAKPLTRQYNRLTAIERWECEDPLGQRVNYYFDLSKVQAGAFN